MVLALSGLECSGHKVVEVRDLDNEKLIKTMTGATAADGRRPTRSPIRTSGRTVRPVRRCFTMVARYGTS